MWRDSPNVGALWGSLIVEELVRNGVDHFVVSPGSRSTPLVQAIARHPRARATVWLDERGAGFHALGLARGGAWAAVVTTSGTAVANLLPAVVEASLDGQPLMLLTADRPPELREVGANQSIRQMGIFSDHVRWAFDLPAPGEGMPARALLTTVDHAVHRMVDGRAGPVQLNCPFREPLALTPAAWDPAYLDGLEAWAASDGPLQEILAGDTTDACWEHWAEIVRQAKRGLVVCGSLPDPADREAVAELSLVLGWPVWTDVLSGMRLGGGVPNRSLHFDRIVGAREAWQPDVVLQFGSRLTSKRMQTALGCGRARHYALVDPEPSRLDPSHRVTQRYVADIDVWCATLQEQLEERPVVHAPIDAAQAELQIEAATDAAVDEGDALSEPYVARWLTRHVHPEHALFLSNSMPIRDVQAYGAGDGPRVSVAANRGASGIDGVVSTAAGFAQGHGAPTTLLIGDVALLHDVGALAMLGPLEQPLTIVVLNNGGGGIFSFLPIAEHPDVLHPFVATPHSISFEGLCADFDLPYVRVETRAAFEEAYEEAAAACLHTLIEVASSLEGNREVHARIEAEIAAEIEKALA